MALSFDVTIQVGVSLTFRASTIWPAVNKLAAEVDAIDTAADSMLAELAALKAKSK